MIRPIFTTYISLLFSCSLFAQVPCGSDIILKNAAKDSFFSQKHADLEADILHFFQKKGNSAPSAEKGNAVGTIPVVVHLLHNGGPENMAEAQVTAAIQYLNDAFANSGHFFQGSGAAANIRFCLASRDPEGNATNGIVRIQTPLTNLNESQDGLAKSLSYWPSQDYLNIWVVREICWASIGCAIGAYASPPGFHGNNSDGIVIESRFFGVTPGATSPLAHEAGHYLGLYHTFEGGCVNNDCLTDGDLICDTPPDQSTAAIPCNQTVNTCNTDAQSGLNADFPDATDNFMDYGDINCQHNFTAGQAARMEYILENPRKSLLASKGCGLPCPAPLTAAFTPGDTIISLNTAVNFTSQTTHAGNITWLLNGQQVSSSANWSYTFAQEGLFTIAMHAQSADTALCASKQVQHTVQVICPVQANFSVNPETPVLNEPVTLTNLSKNYTTLEWLINGVSQGANLNNYTFTEKGGYTVSLVAGNGGCQQEKKFTFTLSAACEYRVFQRSMDTPADPERAKATLQLSDGSLLLAGEGIVAGAANDIIFIKTTDLGTPVWTKRFGNAQNQSVEDLATTSNGGFVMVGNHLAGTVSNGILARFSSEGAVLWQKTVVSTKGSHLQHVIRSGNDYIAVGWYIRDTDQKKSGFILKFNAAGAVVWSRTYADAENNHIEFTDVDVAVANASGIYVSGIVTNANDGDTDGLMLQLDVFGNMPLAMRGNTDDENQKLLGVAYNNTGLRYIGSTTPIGSAEEYGLEIFILDFQNSIAAQPNTYSAINRSVRIQGITKSASAPSYTIYNTGGSGEGGGIMKKGIEYTLPDGAPVYNRYGEAVYYGYGVHNTMEDIAWTQGDDYILTASTADNGSTRAMFLSKANRDGFAGQCTATDVATIGSSGSPFSIATLKLEKTGSPAVTAANFMVADFSVKAISPCSDSVVCAEEACKAGWIKEFGLSVSGTEAILCMANAPDGTIFAAGYRSDSLAFLNISAEGDILYVRTAKIASTQAPRPNSLMVDSDGNWVIAGNLTTATGLTNGFVLKYNPAQNTVLWLKQISGSSRAQTIHEITPGGNYLLNMEYVVSVQGTGLNYPPALTELNRNSGAVVTGGFRLAASPGVKGDLLQLKQYKNQWWGLGNFNNSLALFRFSQDGKEISKSAYHFPGPPLLLKAGDFTIRQDTISILVFTNTNIFYLLQTALDGTVIRAIPILNKEQFANEAPIQKGQIEQLPDGGFIIWLGMGDNAALLRIFRLGRDGTLRWSQQIESTQTLSAAIPNLLLSSNQHLVVQDKYLFIGAGSRNGSISNFWLAKLNNQTGSVITKNCEFIQIFNLAVQPPVQAEKQSLPPDFTQQYSPNFQDKTITFQETIPGEATYPCATPCTEICDNNVNDDYDERPDCFDTECPCGNACDGEGSNIWYFGQKAGLDFSTAAPTVLDNGKTNTRGPSSVQSDPKGRLLFYADSSEVWNRFHQPTTALNPTQNPLIVPIGIPEQYDIFTTDGQNVFFTFFEMRRKQFTGDAGRIKNIKVNNAPGSKFTAYSCNAGGWLAIRLADGNKWLSDRLQTFPLQSFNPFPYSAGADNTGGINNAGQMKFSRDGAYIANTLPATGGFELVNFNQTTGVITEGTVVILPELKNAFGLEFSPNDRYLYISTYGTPSQIWQFDLEAGEDAAAIANSRVLIAQSPIPKNFGYLQLARNGKIYAAMNPNDAGSTALSVIHQPNDAGTKCKFQERGQPLGAGRCYYGLPQFVQTNLGNMPAPRIVGPDAVCGIPARVPLRIRGLSCMDDANVFSKNNGNDIEYGGGSHATLIIGENAPANVTLTKSGKCYPGIFEFYIKVINQPALQLDLGPDITLCASGVTTLRATPGFSRYRWSDGTANSTLTTFGPGKYAVQAWDSCGNIQQDTVEINVEQNTKLQLGPDRRVCRSENTTFVRDAAFTRWQWSPPQYTDCDTCKTVRINPAQRTEYVVIAQTASGCLGADTILIVPDSVFGQLDTAICANQRFKFQDITLPADTTAWFNLISTSGCDSIVTVKTKPLPVPNLTLLPDASLKIGDTLTLRSSSSGGIPPLTLQWSPTENLSCSTCPAPLFTASDTGQVRYLLTAKAANGCTAVGTVILTVNDSCLVYWPNVFTPDGDGTNDTFYLLTFPCVERIVSFDIYNRWGDIVYSRTDLPPNDAASGWNGRTNDGADFPADVLLWTAKVRYYNGKTGVFNGAITLLR